MPAFLVELKSAHDRYLRPGTVVGSDRLECFRGRMTSCEHQPRVMRGVKGRPIEHTRADTVEFCMDALSAAASLSVDLTPMASALHSLLCRSVDAGPDGAADIKITASKIVVNYAGCANYSLLGVSG